MENGGEDRAESLPALQPQLAIKVITLFWRAVYMFKSPPRISEANCVLNLFVVYMMILSFSVSYCTVLNGRMIGE
jgi:hypothetical protein